MSVLFNFNRLQAVYRDAVLHKEPTIAFELRDGPGRFVFMMFFSPEDEGSKDKLFVLLGRTQKLLQLKMYGSHRNGDFKVYVNPRDQSAIRDELNLHDRGPAFKLSDFLQKLNQQIPQSLPLNKTIETLRQEKEFFKSEPDLRNLVDEASKVYLIGVKHLPPDKRPREKTLRKLYLHISASSDVVSSFISYLKEANCTVAWTDDPSKASNDILGMMKRPDRPSRGPTGRKPTPSPDQP